MSSAERVCRGYDVAASALIAAANEDGHWTGELSSSPLSTATAIAALELVQRQQPERAAEFQSLIEAGLHWLIQHQNPDGGWGDTVLSHSNISTTALVYASFRLIGQSVLPRRATDSGLYDHSLDAEVNQTSGGIPSHVSS